MHRFELFHHHIRNYEWGGLITGSVGPPLYTFIIRALLGFWPDHFHNGGNTLLVLSISKNSGTVFLADTDQIITKVVL